MNNEVVKTQSFGPYDKHIKEFMFWNKRQAKAFKRLGLTPYSGTYQLVTDAQMVQLMPYVMMPTDYRSWNKGKQAKQDEAGASGMHIFEAVLNMNPFLCYLGTTNSMPMQLLVDAHAVGGHVDFFANNQLFKQSMPETVLARFAQFKQKVDNLIEDPEWGFEGVEYILDAAHALENFVGWAPYPDSVNDKELREKLADEVRTLKRRIADEGEVSQSSKVALEKQLAKLEARLKLYPLVPANDILGFLANPENTPNLPRQAHVLLDIVHERSKYFQPQARTKFMNEGWASYWEREVLVQPEMDLPIDFRLDLAKYWSMHAKNPLNQYFDPYALGLQIWRYIDRKYGYDEGEDTVKVYEYKRDENGLPYETKKSKTVTVTRRNRDKMFEVRRWYDDNRFITEFLNEELFEFINLQSLEYVRRTMTLVGKMLIKNGWNPSLAPNPLPLTLEGLMQVIQTWMQIGEQSQQVGSQLGTPMFPVPEQTLKSMATLIQIIASFDKNKHMMRKNIVMRTSMHGLPNIAIVDTGRFGDGSWTLKHEYDPTFGPLLQSEARDTLKYFRRLCGAPVRLLTMEVKTDDEGNPVGAPFPYEYFTEDGDTVKERKL